MHYYVQIITVLGSTVQERGEPRETIRYITGGLDVVPRALMIFQVTIGPNPFNFKPTYIPMISIELVINWSSTEYLKATRWSRQFYTICSD